MTWVNKIFGNLKTQLVHVYKYLYQFDKKKKKIHFCKTNIFLTRKFHEKN